MKPENVAFYELASSMDETDAMALVSLGARWLSWRSRVGAKPLSGTACAIMDACETWELMDVEGDTAACIQKRADVLATLLRDARFGALASCHVCGGDSPEGCPMCVGGGV